ncbi:MAG: type II/IV secretion system ATPase subunit [Thermoplasmatales archaeon]
MAYTLSGMNPASCRYMNEGKDTVANGVVSYRDKDFNVLESYDIPGMPVKVFIVGNDYSTLYYVQEPQLDDLQRRILCAMLSSLPRIVMGNEVCLKGDRERCVNELISSFCERNRINLPPESKNRVIYYVKRDVTGYGIIDPMIYDASIEDISCAGPAVPIYVYHRSYGSLETNRRFLTGKELTSFVVSLAQKGGKVISVSDPILDSSTREGHRISATLGKEVTSRGSSFSMRLFKKAPFTPIDLIRLGTANSQLMAFLWFMIGRRKNVLIIGESGVGKTTTLNAISFFIPPWAKLVSIEDTRELNLPHKNWIPAVTRGVRTGESGLHSDAPDPIDMFDLLRMALRQRPEYLIIGEIRGKEAYSLFQAMSTGQTTLGTIHADSLQSLLNRLENPPLSIPSVMLSSLDLIVKVSLIRKSGKTERRISAVTAVSGLTQEYGEISAQNVFEWDQGNDRINFLYPRPYLRILSRDLNMQESELLDEIRKGSVFLDEVAGKIPTSASPQETFNSIHSAAQLAEVKGGS